MRFMQTFENYETGKVNIPIGHWKSDSSEVTMSASDRAKYMEKTEKINNFFNELFKDLRTFKLYGSLFFYTLNKDGSKKLWMEDYKAKTLFCQKRDFWDFFEKEIGLNYNEIQSLIKNKMEQYLNRAVGTPKMDYIWISKITLY